ncbi:MAG: tRNA pseudouridine(38-40) synthase TruA [Eubacteriaceae bacterium]|nr:tRNA pseudouridine(38-40) synthase TruA [Eubacteriaceae bacterium]
MKNILLTISYQGTRYAGWQRQKNAITVEEELNHAIEKLTGENVTLIGAGRTDAGVHALAQNANFKTDFRIPPERFAFALNAHLPLDIRVMASTAVPETFHSRFCAKGKIYSYRLCLADIATPFEEPFSWRLQPSLDIAAMEAGSHGLIGEHDFSSFMASGSSVKTTVRRIDKITFKQQGPILTITFCGGGFLYNMVRILVGTLVEMGQNRRKAESMTAIIDAKNRSAAGITAPAKGLFLKQVLYNVKK